MAYCSQHSTPECSNVSVNEIPPQLRAALGSIAKIDPRHGRPQSCNEQNTRITTKDDCLSGDATSSTIHDTAFSCCFPVSADEVFGTSLTDHLSFGTGEDMDHDRNEGDDILEDIVTILRQPSTPKKCQATSWLECSSSSLLGKIYEPARLHQNVVITEALFGSNALEHAAVHNGRQIDKQRRSSPTISSGFAEDSKIDEPIPVHQASVHYVTTSALSTSTPTPCAESFTSSQHSSRASAPPTSICSCQPRAHEIHPSQRHELSKTDNGVLATILKESLRRRRARAEMKARRLRQEALVKELRKENAAMRQRQEMLRREISWVKEQLKKSKRNGKNSLS